MTHPDIVIDQIPVNFKNAAFLNAGPKQLGDSHRAELLEHVRIAKAIARPKALYLSASILLPRAQTVEVLGHSIENPILYANLQRLNRVFVFIITCGVELAEWKNSLSSAVDRFFADLVSEHALGAAYNHLAAHITAAYHAHGLASMNPGSTPGWQIEDQRIIFSILKNAKEKIGVELRDSFFMVPTHSASGILFESEKGYQNCQLCALENCPNRSAPFNPAGYEHLFHAM